LRPHAISGTTTKHFEHPFQTKITSLATTSRLSSENLAKPVAVAIDFDPECQVAARITTEYNFTTEKPPPSLLVECIRGEVTDKPKHLPTKEVGCDLPALKGIKKYMTLHM
jgi:hypothetical protein